MHGLDAVRWDDLRILLAVLRHGSFTGAAERLAVEQSTVSRRIASLEAALGAPLFDRTPQGPRPTEIGQALQAHLERIEAEVFALSEHVQGTSSELSGRVRVSTTESFAVQVLIPEMLARLRKTHPGLAIDLVLSDSETDLVQREADLAATWSRSVSRAYRSRSSRTNTTRSMRLATRAHCRGSSSSSVAGRRRTRRTWRDTSRSPPR